MTKTERKELLLKMLEVNDAMAPNRPELAWELAKLLVYLSDCEHSHAAKIIEYLQMENETVELQEGLGSYMRNDEGWNSRARVRLEDRIETMEDKLQELNAEFEKAVQYFLDVPRTDNPPSFEA
jgi:ABC-type phosphate transport system auxiliary subunit